MSARRVTVLYEDEQVQGTRTYGPHVLLLACIADTVGGSPWALRESIRASPQKGDGNLKKALQEDGANLANAGPLVAMFDHDKVRPCYALPQEACKRDLLRVIDEHATGGPKIVLLEQNMEDLVDACCSALNRPKPRTKPKPLERDGVLHAAAADATARAKILVAVPSFARLVRAVLSAYTTLALVDGGDTPS